MKVLSFASPAVVLGLLFFGIVPPFKEVTATHQHNQSASDNTKDDDHLEERSITKEAGIKPEASLFLPGAPVAALNDHQRHYHMYTMNRKLDLSSCEDSPLKVLTKKNIKSAKKCAFISKKPWQRCKRDDIKSHCPNACGYCESFGTADSEATFLFEGDKTNCAWLHDLVTPSTLTELSYWCQLDSLLATCRETCGFFCADEPEQSNAPSLSPPTCSDKITSIINEQFGDVAKGPPQEQALAWLVEDITNDECDDEAMIMQRYILAVLYYSTGGDDWRSDEGWLGSGNECDWDKLDCNENQQVTSVDLNWNNLYGTIPVELSSLDNLGLLWLYGNSLQGSIPGRIFELPKLEYLFLHANYLTGKIPDNFGGSSSLKKKNLSMNSLTGTIPDITGDSLQNIEELSLHSNDLSGSIPGRIFQLPKLERLGLFGNDLTGTIPDNFGGSSTLEVIDLFDNLLTGTIPDVTGDSLESIEILRLDQNKLSGPVPEGICALRSSKPIQFWRLYVDCAPPDNAQNPCPSGCCTKCNVGKGLP